jgi:hypothetical protein
MLQLNMHSNTAKLRSGDVVNAAAVRNANSALDVKRIGAKITFPDEWLLQRDGVMHGRELPP